MLSIHGWSLHDSGPDDTFLTDMQELSIFSKLSFGPQNEILSVH
jgi:hypothetical protein